MAWSQPNYLDGLTAPARCGLPVPSCAVLGLNETNIITEEWQQLLVNNASRVPLALNTAHPEYTAFALVEEMEPQDVGGAMIRWKRIYAKAPSTHSEFESVAYSYPGVIDFVNVAGSNLLPRAEYNQLVTSRVQHDYFLIGAAGTGLVTGAYASVDLIPEVLAFRVVLTGTFSAAMVGAWYALSPLNFVIKTGGDTANGLTWPAETCPNVANYFAMVKDAKTNGWAAGITTQPVTVDATTGFAYIALTGGTVPDWKGQIVAENSRLSRWRGNIYLRTTRYVLAI